MDTCSRDPQQSREKSGTPKDATVAVTVGGVRSAGKKKHLIPRPETRFDIQYISYCHLTLGATFKNLDP